MNDWAQYKGVSGIYAIENTVNGKVYIGQAQNIYVRWKQHLRELTAGVHHSQKLQRAWNKHGHQAFRFAFIDPCDVDGLNACEQTWLDGMKAVAEGYNICPVANSIKGIKRSAESKAKQSEGMKKAHARPESRKRYVEGAKRRSEDPLDKAIRSAATTKSHARPEVRAKISEVVSKALSSPEARDAASRRAIKACARPEVKAQRAKGQKERWDSLEARNQQSERLKIVCALPETKARRSASQLESWTDPEIRAKRSEANRRSQQGRSALTRDVVDQMRARYVPKCAVNGGSAMAREFKVSQSLVQQILARKIWV